MRNETDGIDCPDDLVCLTWGEWEELMLLLETYEVEYDAPEFVPLTDTEAVIQLGWDILFLSPWELAYIAIPMSVLAFYGLSIYGAYLYIKRRFSP